MEQATWQRLADEQDEQRLAPLDRLAAEVLAIQLDQVEARRKKSRRALMR